MATGQNGNGSGGRRVLSIEQRPDGVAIVRMDVPGETMNTLQANFAEEFVQVFDDLDKASEVRAVVFTSGKPDSFIAGADVRMIKAVKTAAEAAELSRTGQRAMARVEAFRAPVVAAIHGACLGGGLETALACHARIASDDKKTKLGLPEVQRGLLPAAAGTQRLPRLVGVQAALDLMLTGKQIDGRRARRMGLVDDVVPAAVLVDVACRHALALAERGASQPTGFAKLKSFFSKEELTELALAENPLGRKLLFDQAKKQLLAKTRGNYPAAERILAQAQRLVAPWERRQPQVQRMPAGLMPRVLRLQVLRTQERALPPMNLPIPVHAECHSTCSLVHCPTPRFR